MAVIIPAGVVAGFARFPAVYRLFAFRFPALL